MATKERPLDPRALDVAALCQQGATLQGAWPLAGMQRLAESLAAVPDDDVPWQAWGELLPVTGGAPQMWLQLGAEGRVLLQCQRCLQPMTETLLIDRRIRFVRDEDEAARLDEESEDDVLALPPRLDLHALLEDELILALPLVPRHDVCPEPLPLPDEASVVDASAGEAEDAKPHPFAALAALRDRKR